MPPFDDTATLEELELQFAENPLDLELLQKLSQEYLGKGAFNRRSLPAYEKALMAAPRDAVLTEALNLSVFLRHLRRFTVDTPEVEQVDPEGIRETIALIQEYLKKYPTSPDLFAALGDLHMLKGNVLLAIGAFENSVRFGNSDLRPVIRTFEAASRLYTFPPSERAYFAHLYDKLGLKDEALQVYRDAVSQGFYDSDVIASLVRLLGQAADQESNHNAANTLRMEIAELHLLTGDQQSALKAFAAVKFPVNQNFPLVKRIAAILIDVEDYRLAFDYLSRIPVDEENKELLNRIASELERIGELDTAVYLLRFINDNDLVIKEANALREKDMEIHTELAVAELAFSNRRYDQALTSYTKVLQLGYKEDGFILSKVIELLPLITHDHLDDFHHIGAHFLQKHDYYRAMQFYQLALERLPNDAEAISQLRQIYDSILERNPNLPELRLRSGDLYMQVEMLENAVAEFKHAAQFPETHVEATRRLAVAYMKRHNFTLAVEAFQSIPVHDIDLENLYQLHLIMADRGRVAEALNMLRTINELDDSYRDVEDRLELLNRQMAEESSAKAVDPKILELIGDIAVGRYEYVERIGSGGMGVVHKVIDNKLGRTVAMKILREGLSNSSKAIERFFREARIAATLNHRHIVNIFDYNINQQMHRSYISMEYVEGPNLRELFETYINQGREEYPERVNQALFYLSQICDALGMTHSKGIIHRDIKPDNILVSLDHVAKITDFGIVHIEEATFTPTGAVIGTPRYMAPEQVQGTRLDGRADLYSMGIILYEWLVGSPPFISGDIAYQQVNMPPSSVMDHNPDVPRMVNDIAMKCLEKNPADRFQNARDLKVALDAALKKLAPEGMPHLAPPPEPDLDTIQ